MNTTTTNAKQESNYPSVKLTKKSILETTDFIFMTKIDDLG